MKDVLIALGIGAAVVAGYEFFTHRASSSKTVAAAPATSQVSTAVGIAQAAAPVVDDAMKLIFG